MAVTRFDRADFSKAVRLDNGCVKAPARLTRTGVFTYRQADGSIVRELRLPEEVFHADSLASFNMVPLTDDHPYKYKGRVTASNAKELTIGFVGNTRQDGNFVAGEVMVMDVDGVAKVLGGKTQLSCGYTCDREVAASGAEYEGQKYDFIQRNIRGNHVAIVAVGRAGPEARINLDAGNTEDLPAEDITLDAQTETPAVVETPAETPVIAEVKADAVVEVVPETPAIPEVVEAKETLEQAAIRADAAEREIARLAEELKAANDPARLQKLVANRVALESKALAACPTLKCDGLSDVELMKAAVQTLDSEVTLDGKSDDAIEAYFNSVIKYARKRNVVTEAAAKSIAAGKPTKLDSEESPREKFYKTVFGKR